MWESFTKIISQYLEINESRRSVVVILLICVTGMGLYKMYFGMDIPPNVTNVIISLSGFIFGVNAISSVTSAISSYQSNNLNYNNINQTITPNNSNDDAGV